ncbi:MAG TPA: RNA 2',3'-cyclic phosphodiesterase [Gemmatimonadaceae bacterium]|jgi:RNA 2',3'-cyclic 3'-phosphodiesterase|nr:RNA 2',3'-cyclic phosphodiesterase [Gemmatimonadaceae bacterium]
MTSEPAEKPERLFIGVPLTDEARQGLQKVLPRNLPGKLIPPPNWHFTLRFLGPTLPSARDDIIARLKTATCGSAFTIRFAELGAFPLPRRARILWVGVDEGVERLSQLGAIAEAAARSAGFPAEEKEFRPHLTLSRIEPPSSVKTLLSTNMKVGLRMPVTSVVLYRSRLGGGPARYEEVERFELSPS